MDVCACVCVCITKIFVSIKGLGLVISTFFWLLYMLIWLYFFLFFSYDLSVRQKMEAWVFAPFFRGTAFGIFCLLTNVKVKPKRENEEVQETYQRWCVPLMILVGFGLEKTRRDKFGFWALYVDAPLTLLSCVLLDKENIPILVNVVLLYSWA